MPGKGGGQSKYVVFGKRSGLNEGVGACTSKSLLHQAHQHTNSLLFKTKSTLFFYLANVYVCACERLNEREREREKKKGESVRDKRDAK